MYAYVSTEADALLLARQPILDREGAVIGFELLYRRADPASGFDPQHATASVLLAGLAEIGLDHLVGGRDAFVNVTRDLLLSLDPLPVPPRRVVLELVEDQLIDDQLLDALRGLRGRGFRIALDDFVLTPETAPLLEHANIVKLDIQALDRVALVHHVHALREYDVTLLAEKVETEAEHMACVAMGFDAFQGYYFAKPAVLRTVATPTHNLSAVSDLVRVGSPLTFEELADLITKDPGLSHRFLRLVNSALYPSRSAVGSIHEGLARLGTIAVRRWAVVMVLSQIVDRPGFLLTLGLQRARTCELLAGQLPSARPNRCFTVGLLSVLDSLVNRPMEGLLSQLPLDERINQALLCGEGSEGQILSAVIAHEHGDFDACKQHGVDAVDISVAHRRAVKWADLTSALLT